MTSGHRLSIMLLAVALSGVSSAYAQNRCETDRDCPWSVEFAIGWDNSISGNINSGAVGRLDNQTVVITKNRYEDVYGTGLNIRFGGGYMWRENTELRATFTFQSLDADLTRMGDFGSSNLYGQYSDYQTFAFDVGVRRYTSISQRVRAYGEGTVGLGFVDSTDITLVAPAVGFIGTSTPFYDSTAAVALGASAGVLVPAWNRLGFFAQFGFRYMSGMDQVDNFVGTGLNTINDDSARWSIPIIVGVRGRF